MSALEIRKTGDSCWQVIHLPTGLPISANLKEVPYENGKNKKRDVTAFYNRIKDAFPWAEWKNKDEKPDWANDAYRFCHHPDTQTVTATNLSHFASYFINGDDSDLTPKDKKQANAFRKWLGGDIVDCYDVGFMWDHDGQRFGTPAGDCQEYTAFIRA